MRDTTNLSRAERQQKTPPRTKKRWTKEQIRILKRLHKSHSNAEIAEALGRAVTSVVHKSHKLGLRKGVRRLRKMGQENIRRRWGE
jgi:DNA-binding NarL/FixJ family response regulator